MGLCSSSEGPQAIEKKRLQTLQKQNASIMKKANSIQREEMRVAKLLLLGAGESGKSTFFKQMIKHYGDGYSKDDREQALFAVNQNIIESTQALIDASKEFGGREGGVNLDDSDLSVAVREVLERYQKHFVIDEEFASHLRCIWNDPVIQQTYSNRAKFQLYDSTAFFFENLDRIAKPDFVPTDDDILRVRVKTTGLIKQDFELKKFKIRMLDVGGQRNERRKWIHCFEGVTAVIFVAAISEYDQMCFEDSRTNRLDEALQLFDNVSNSEWFATTPIILFLNKKDLFDVKFPKVSLSVCFDDWNNGSIESAYDFISRKFQVLQQTERDLYIHFTTALDSENFLKVFDAVRGIVLQAILAQDNLIQ